MSETPLNANRKYTAAEVASHFDPSVKAIRDQDGKIASRRENGYFYFNGRRNDQAFYLEKGERAEVAEKSRLSRDVLRSTVEKGNEKKRKGFFSRLFSRGDQPDTDKTFVIGDTARAEYGINTTLCAKTARNNAENIFGITNLPRGDAGEVLKKLSSTKPSISLDRARNTSGVTQVAYIGVDVLNGKTKKSIGHTALAVKPNGSTEWFISDPYQGGQGFIRLKDYPSTVTQAYALSPKKDNLSTMRLRNNLQVVQYKKGILGSDERATNTPEIEYGQVTLNENNLFYALGDRDFNGTMGDDLRRKRFLGLIPYGRKRSTNISDEYHITKELQLIADLPKTRVADFIAQCVEAGGGGKYKFGNRQDVIRTLFTTVNGKPVATQAHKSFLTGFDLLNKSGYIDQIKSTDKLGSIKDAQEELPTNIKLEDYIADKLTDDSLFDSGTVDRNSPLYAYMRDHRRGIASQLSKQVGIFLSNNGMSVGAGVDVTKHIKVVAGIAGGKPGVGIMFHGSRDTSWGKLNGAIGVWNGIPVASAGVAFDLNKRAVAGRLNQYDDAIKRIGVSGIISPSVIGGTLDFENNKMDAMKTKIQTLVSALETGRISELPAEIQEQIQNLYKLMGRENYSKAMAAVVSVYKQKLIDANQGWSFKGVSIGGGLFFGLPTILGAIRFAYIEKRMIPDARQLREFVERAMTEGDNNKVPEMHAKGVGGINERISKFGGKMPFTAASGIIDGRNALRFTNRVGKMALNVYAAPGFRENIRYQNGVVDVVQLSGKFPTIKTFTVHVGSETRYFMIVGGTNIQGASQVKEGHNETGLSGGNFNNTKTFAFDYYHTEDTIPNEGNADEHEIALGVMLSRKPEEKKTKSEEPEEPEEPNPRPRPRPRPRPKQQSTQPGADGPQVPTEGTLEQGVVVPETNAQIGASPASQQINAPSTLPGGTNLGTNGPLQ